MKRVLGAGRYSAVTTPNMRSISVGIMHVRRLLDPVNAPARMYFSKKLLEQRLPHATWPSLMAYGYEKQRGNKPISDNPIKDDVTSDACDAVRYLAINFFPSVKLASRVYSIA